MASSEILKQIAQEAIDYLDHLNQQYPNLASETSIEAVEKWRRQVIEFDSNANENSAPSGTLEVTNDEPVGHDGSLEFIEESGSNETTKNEPDIVLDESQQESNKEIALKENAVELLKTYDLEEVIDKMASQYDCMMNSQQLVDLVGQSAYVESLKREVAVFAINAVTYDQAANLWNSLGRPSLNGDAWEGREVSMLSQ
ncbi:MAG: hypothetical protein L3J28_06375 [Candidatus Polarisedimenticolaceae bacterium]|nr:hypothetical protein [Candidatus Polarisedimenticolaceae bacterium]